VSFSNLPYKSSFNPPSLISSGKVRFRLFPVLLIASLLLAGDFFPASIGFAEEQAGRIRIRLWHSWRSEQKEILDSIIEDFNCTHKDIEVVTEGPGATGWSASERMLKESVSVGLPELALVGREMIPLLADAGRIRPLDDFLEASTGSTALLKPDNLLDSARAYATCDDNLFGLPIRLNPYVLIYNPDLLSTAGLKEPPRDWKSLARLAHVVSEDAPDGTDSRAWALSVRSMAALFDILCMQKGVDLLDAKSVVEHVEILGESLDFIQGLRKPPALLPPQYKFWDNKFLGVAGGRVLFQVDNVSMLSHLVKSSSIPIAVGQVPCDSAFFRTYLSGSPVFVMSSMSDADDAIGEFLAFLYSPEHYSRFADRLLFVPPFKDAASALRETSLHREIYSQIVLAAKNAGVHSLHVQSGTVLPHVARIVEQLDAGLISMEQALEDMIGLIGREDPLLTSVGAPFRVSWAESTRRLFANDISGFQPAPVRIISARNEHEPFQLALSAENPMDGVRLTVSPFVSRDGKPGQIETTIYQEDDTHISTPLVAAEPGQYPNVLRPQESIAIVPRRLTRLWVDCFVADDVPEGEYAARITIKHQDTGVARVPIQLRVLPLKIPETPSHPATVGLNYDRIADYYGLEKGTADYRRKMDLFYWFLVDRRLSPYAPPVPPDSTELGLYLEDKRVTACRLPLHPKSRRFKKAVTLAREGGWLDKLFSYFIDEPTYHQYRAIVKAGERIHSMPAPPKFLVTCFPDDLLTGAVDIWCVHLGFLPEGVPHGVMDRQRYADAVKCRLEAGDEVWWYTAGPVKPFPTLQIEDDPSAFRIIPWLQQLYDIKGFLHWEAANWIRPFDEPLIQFFGNGEGVLVYPGDLQPIPSIRLELLREGLEDMEYLMLLRRGVEELQKTLKAERFGDSASSRIEEICRRLITDKGLRANAMTGSLLLPYFEREPGTVEKVREEVAGEIVALARRPLALVLTDPGEKQYTDSAEAKIFGVVEPGCRIEVNDRTLTVDENGDFSASFPLSIGTNSFRIHLEKGDYRKTVIRNIERL